MVFDRDEHCGVAWVARISECIRAVSMLAFGTLLLACGPSVKPPPPPDQPGPLTQGQKPVRSGTNARQVLVGEMCPQGAGGRPAVAPLIMRGVSWVDTPSE